MYVVGRGDARSRPCRTHPYLNGWRRADTTERPVQFRLVYRFQAHRLKCAASNPLARDRAVGYSGAHDPFANPFDYLRRNVAGGITID